ncbi:MAG: FlgK family flagellar hook-associated protein [Bacillota bacterium]
MPGTWFGLEIAKRGTMAHRKALDVTGHNITNANTPGYSRQEAVLKPTDPWTIPDLATKMLPGQLGTGSSVAEVRRIRDYYLDVQSRQSDSYEGYWEKKLDMAKRMETVFPEPDGRGLQAVLLNFFNDWQDVNNNPEDPGVKKAVIESGDELAAIFRQMHTQLQNVGDGIAVLDPAGPSVTDMTDQYTRVVSGALSYEAEKVNQILKRIADLSNSIIRINQNGAAPNDLLDQRDNLLDQLAQIGNIKTDISDNGAISVKLIDVSGTIEVIRMNGGLAEAAKVGVFEYTSSPDKEHFLFVDYDGTFDIADSKINLTDIAEYKTGIIGSGQGSLLGLESSRLDNLFLLSELNDLARAIKKEVNEASGLDGVTITGKYFFDDATTGAADIKLGVIADDINGRYAIDVARLRSTPVAIGTITTTFENYYQAIVAQVGASVHHHDNMLENQQAIGQQIESLRQSVSGVSVDEELTRVIQYQYGYQASARMIGLQDEMLDYLINRIR